LVVVASAGASGVKADRAKQASKQQEGSGLVIVDSSP